MALPADYVERTYAGVLGKIIGVYLGRPFEGWSYEAITEHLGDINYYGNYSAAHSNCQGGLSSYLSCCFHVHYSGGQCLLFHSTSLTPAVYKKPASSSPAISGINLCRFG